MNQKIRKQQSVVIIGAGGAGLSTSYYLTQLGVEHIILERGQVGNTWATERWDSFHLVNPNWAVRLPSFYYNGSDPDGFLSRDQTVDYLHHYADHIAAPVYTGVEVTSLSKQDACYRLLLNDRWGVENSGVENSGVENSVVESRVVVVATGAFGPPRIPEFSAQLSGEIFQLHSAQYKNADQLPPGGVLVVGSGQSGAQIAEDLQDAGRRVYLSVSSAGRRPRRYRGRDSSWWMRELGHFDRTLDNIDAEARQRVASGGSGGKGSGHVGGGKGGHDIYLRAFCRDGMTLLGSIADADGHSLVLRQNLLENLRRADEAALDFKRAIDEHIAQTGMDAPADDQPDPPGLEAWPAAESPTRLDLEREGITAVVWATGFGYNYDWIQLPVGDDRGYPVQTRGVTRWPGLYFMGLQWMYGANSAQFYGVREDAEYVAGHIADFFPSA
ncbi:MAG: NAD(P)-binding domain-containing protein [Caldilineaceae bacterium]